ncbi:MAG: chromosome segregation protein SMC [Myxococcota bacterium]
MKIRKLEIQGFKSFADRTVVHFDSGITCVVGPNGCGKSNIVDSLRWCLGEQSAKHLRGDAMSDVIFGGSESRGPLGMAEVSITFANEGTVSGDFSAYPEITVTRRLYRSGESEYLVNKQQVRLKDVQDIVLGTGIGTKGYSIIEQGRIGMIVSSKPEDRRRLIEEAAGITKYKARRQAAERKMEATRQNLLRVGDLVTELGKRLGVLKRQAAKAEKFKALRAELRDIELHDAALQHLELRVTTHVDRENVSAQYEHVTGLEARLAVLDADAEIARLQLLDDEKRLQGLQTKLYQLDQEVRLAEQNATHQEASAAALERRSMEAEAEAAAQRGRLTALMEEAANLNIDVSAIAEEMERAEEASERANYEVSELTTQRDTITRQADDTRNAINALASQETAAATHLEQVGRRLAEIRQREARWKDELGVVEAEREAVQNSLRMGQEAVEMRRDEKARLEEERETITGQLSDASEKLKEAWAEVNRLQEELGRKRNRLHGLEEVHNSLARAPEGVRTVINWGRSGDARGVHGVLADYIETPAKYEGAVAAALGHSLDDVVVDDVQAAMDIARRLRRESKGRATLLPRHPRLAPHDRPAIDDADWLVDHLKIREGMEEVVKARLGDVLVVKDLGQAHELFEKGVSARLVTLQGDLLSPTGELSGGSADEAGQTYLRQRREISELQTEAQALEAQLNAADDVRARFHFQVEDLKAADRRVQEALQNVALRLLEAEKDLHRLEDQASRLNARRDVLTTELQQTTELITELTAEERGHMETLQRANAERQEREAQVGELNARAAAIQNAYLEATARATELRIRAETAKSRREHVERTLANSERVRTEVEELVARLQAQAQQARDQGIMLIDQSKLERQKALEKASEAAHVRGMLEGDRANYEEAQKKVAAAEAEARGLRTQATAAQNNLGDLKLRLKEREMALEHLHQRIREVYQLNLLDVIHDYHLRPLPDAGTQERIVELRRAIDNMGEINLTAIEECRDVEERHTFLRTQQDDLTHALNQLDRAITKINKTTKRRFQEAFEAINERFKELFPRLFRGGKAWLQMTDPENLLETGIEIFAQPPGKKVSTVQLLSGGEKALTAVSLVFSIFLIKPSPFCLMDEVDAPLDEANVGRFNELVRDVSAISQFIIITHNKRTMEIADNFYGITMEEPGVSKLVNVRVNSASLTQPAARPAPTPA